MVNQAKVLFHYTDQRFHFPDRNKMKVFLGALARKEGSRLGALNYIFCSDEYLLQINQEQLKHDTYTDIITFPYSAKGEALVSDIFVSVERVRENASEFGVPFTHELYRVMFHGLLHLCGYKDKSKADQKVMREREDYWLEQYLRST
ncbi:MAG: rRNA maturation RNase YbeY [Chitinophagaceae bacterium]|nr:MAG: rRNA maturation RNase YbeY [Chitinophagaceae bacterium]